MAAPPCSTPAEGLGGAEHQGSEQTGDRVSGLRIMKRRKQTCSSAVKAPSKASGGRRRREKAGRKRQKLDKVEPKLFSRNPAAAASAAPLSDKASRIVCECQWGPDRTRCSASPLPQEGKENEEEQQQQQQQQEEAVGRRPAAGGCRLSCLLENRDDEDMDGCEVGGCGVGVFPDDDSNQILPVEQFFGNLDAMQDGPQTVVSGTGALLWAPRGENHLHSQRHRRRRHYYAPVDSGEEEEEEEEEQLSDGHMQLS